MKTVWKYAINNTDLPTTHRVPPGSRVVRFGEDPAGLTAVWVEHGDPSFDGDSPTDFDLLSLRIVGTGHLIDDDEQYVGSVNEGPFVWHCYMIQTSITNSGKW